jgi:hypothetical protein
MARWITSRSNFLLPVGKETPQGGSELAPEDGAEHLLWWEVFRD